VNPPQHNVIDEQYVRLKGGRNISVESLEGEDGCTINYGGEPIVLHKMFGPLSLPDVRVWRDGDQLVVGVEQEHECVYVQHPTENFSFCKECENGLVWVEVYRK
jgi:hypothetical protein